MVKINFTMPVIFVKDIKVSKDFYQELFSLEIDADFGENIFFKSAFSIWQEKRAREIIFENYRKDKTNYGNNVELYFETNEIESIWDRVKISKAQIIHPIKEEKWGQRVFRFYDPDKFIIEVAEPMTEVIKRYYKNGLSVDCISTKTQMPIKTIKSLINESEL